MPEALHSDSETIVAAGNSWRRRIAAEFDRRLFRPDNRNVCWCGNVYEALAQAVALKQQGGAGVVCVMVDYLNGGEMGVFTRLSNMAHISKVIAFSASAKGAKLVQAKGLGADETWILGVGQLPAGQEVPLESQPEQDHIETPAKAEAEGVEAEPAEPDSVARSTEPLLTKEELDALLG